MLAVSAVPVARISVLLVDTMVPRASDVLSLCDSSIQNSESVNDAAVPVSSNRLTLYVVSVAERS